MQKTKIIATLGPACYKKDTIQQMVDNGLNVVRINMSHIQNANKIKTLIVHFFIIDSLLTNLKAVRDIFVGGKKR